MPRPSFAQGYACHVGEAAYPDLWQGLEGFWAPTLGPQGITTLRDLTGRKRHGTLEGSMTHDDWVVGPGGWALDLDGSNDAVDMGNLGLTSRNGTLAARVNFDSVPGDGTQLAALCVTDAGHANALQVYVGVHRISASDHRIITVIRTSATTNWVHYGHTVVSPGVDYDLGLAHQDGLAPQLYVNGALQSLTLLSGAPDLSTTAWWDNFTSDGNTIGVKKVNTNQSYWDGKIYWAGIWSRYLVASEFRAMHQGATPLVRRGRPRGRYPSQAALLRRLQMSGLYVGSSM